MEFKDFLRSYVYPVATLTGSIIGVGFFALPYVALQVGVWVMMGYFAVVGALVVMLHVIFTEISLKTPDFKRFPGFVGFYLGRKAELLAMFISIVSGFGVLLAYLIVGGEFLTSIFLPIFGGDVFGYTMLYFIAASIIIFLGIKIVSRVELWVLLLLFFSVVFVFIEGFSKIKIGNIFVPTAEFSIKSFFLPFAPLLFALWGTGLIPEVEEMIADKKRLMKKIVIIASLIPAVFYILFVLLILSISGSVTTDTALTGLGQFLGNRAIMAALFAGVLATFVAFIAQGFLLERTLVFDLKIKKWHAFVIACFTPLIFFLIGFKSFIPLISLLGGVLFGISGILILAMYKKIGGKKIVIYPLSLVFLLGIIYQLVYFFS